MKEALDKYFDEAPEQHKEVMKNLRSLFLNNDLNITESYKWSRPVYGCPKDFAYIKHAKNHVTLGFYDASILFDPEQKLEGEGKNMKHLKIKKWSEVNVSKIQTWISSSAKSV